MATFEETVLLKLDEISAKIDALGSVPDDGGDEEPAYKVATVTDDKTLAHFVRAMNNAKVPRPIMEIYPSAQSKAYERFRYDEGATVKVLPAVIKADSGSEWYQIAPQSTPVGVKVALYLNKADVKLG